MSGDRYESTFEHGGDVVPLVSDQSRPRLARLGPVETTEAFRRARIFGDSYMRATRDGGDVFLQDLAADRGFAGMPQKVDEAGLRDVVQRGGTELWRGFSDEPEADLFTSGPYFAGKGYRGNGIHAASGSAADARAYALADAGPRPVVLHMALDPEARLPSYEMLRRHGQEETERWHAVAVDAGRPSRERQDAAIHLSVAADLGRLAAAEGYDAVRVSPTEMLVLNRSLLHVSNERRAAR